MLTQALITLPQSAPPQTAAKGADARNDTSTVQGRGGPSSNKTDDQPADSFGAVLSRQLEEKNLPAEEAVTANARTLSGKKLTDGKDMRAEQDQLPAPDGATQAFAALLLANPEPRLNTAVPVDGAAAAGKVNVGKDALAATGLPAAGEKVLQSLENQKTPAAGAANLLTASGKDLNGAAEFKLTPVKEEVQLNQHEPAINTQAGLHAGTQAGALAAAGLQASALQAATTQQPASVQTQIAAPLHSSVWPDEFSQKVTWISTQQNQSAELLLNPPDLGPVRVVLNVTDNQATALFSSPHAAVRDAIENALPKLREVMADNGIMLGNASVNDQAARDSSGFMNQRPSARMDTTPSGIASIEPSAMTTPVTATRRHIGMVDTFA